MTRYCELAGSRVRRTPLNDALTCNLPALARSWPARPPPSSPDANRRSARPPSPDRASQFPLESAVTPHIHPTQGPCGPLIYRQANTTTPTTAAAAAIPPYRCPSSDRRHSPAPRPRHSPVPTGPRLPICIRIARSPLVRSVRNVRPSVRPSVLGPSVRLGVRLGGSQQITTDRQRTTTTGRNVKSQRQGSQRITSRPRGPTGPAPPHASLQA